MATLYTLEEINNILDETYKRSVKINVYFSDKKTSIKNYNVYNSQKAFRR